MGFVGQPSHRLSGDQSDLLARQTELLRDVHRALEQLLAEVRLLARLTQGNAGDRALLTLRAAARRLGVDRGTTLANMIADREIRTVRLKGKLRIPASEIERICREGTTRRATSPRLTPLPQPQERSRSPGAAIRALKL